MLYRRSFTLWKRFIINGINSYGRVHTIPHHYSILFGESGWFIGCLCWLAFYLTDIFQGVRLGDPVSAFRLVLPRDLSLAHSRSHYTPLSTVISDHSVLHHLYADDTHLYVFFASQDSITMLGHQVPPHQTKSTEEEVGYFRVFLWCSLIS